MILYIIRRLSSFLIPILITCLWTWFVASFTSCENEPEPVTFATVRKIHPMEGIYKGSYTIDCDSLGLHKTVTNHTVYIGSFSTEMLCINSFTAAVIFPSANQYQISKMYWVDVNDCGTKKLAYEFMGTGKLEGNTLTENGKVIITYRGKDYSGDWHSQTTKQ